MVKNDKSSKIEIVNKKIKPKPSRIYDTYWKFAFERQRIFFNRLNDDQRPWTEDVILRQYKFTNVYRACDRVSQYLIKDVIYNVDENINNLVFRILLFKSFNKIETWELIERHVGYISYDTYSYNEYVQVLDKAKQVGQSIYSGAYIMASGRSAFGHDKKHQNHLKLLERIISDDVPSKLQNSKTMLDVYNTLLLYPTIGEFLAYQYAIDMNYSTITNFSEKEFVKAGPGAKDGILKCFDDIGEYSYDDIIRMMTDIQEFEFERLNLNFKNLWGRELQMIDCQNIFCEVDKYARVAYPEFQGISNRTRIKQKYTLELKEQIEFFFPPKWNINHLIPRKHG